MRRVRISLENGEVFFAAGFASQVHEAVEAAKLAGTMVTLERDVIPTGQSFYLDPTQIASIRDD